MGEGLDKLWKCLEKAKNVKNKELKVLASKVFSLERLYPLLSVQVSRSQTNIFPKNLREKKLFVRRIFGSKNFGFEKNLGLKKFDPPKLGPNNFQKHFWV